MAKHLSEVEVKLENPVEIAKTGHQEEASLVLMRAPSMNCMKQASKIRNLCSMAEMAILKEAHAQQQDEPPPPAEPKEESEKQEPKPYEDADLYMTALNTLDFDFDTAYQAFTHILTIGGCGFIDGEKITKPIIEDLSFSDFERLFGVYVKTFF